MGTLALTTVAAVDVASVCTDRMVAMTFLRHKQVTEIDQQTVNGLQSNYRCSSPRKSRAVIRQLYSVYFWQPAVKVLRI